MMPESKETPYAYAGGQSSTAAAGPRVLETTSLEGIPRDDLKDVFTFCDLASRC